MADSKDYNVTVNLPAKMGGDAIAQVLTQIIDQHRSQGNLTYGIESAAKSISTAGLSAAGDVVYIFTLTMRPV